MMPETMIAKKLVACWKKRREYQIRLLQALGEIRRLQEENERLRREVGQ
jgi:hypothetical protein